MNKLVIFDLDGTLLDTSRGILHCYRKTGELLNLERKLVDNESCVIGGPLSDGFNTLYNIESSEQLEEAITTYRQLYQREGIKLYAVYDGIEDTLRKLRDSGYLLAVATLKFEAYAKQMLSEVGLSQYFDVIYGWDGTDSCTKAVILNKALSTLNVALSDAILVGDSVYDEKGAETAGIDFLGVSYGFGIKKADTYHFSVVNTPGCVSDHIINNWQK